MKALASRVELLSVLVLPIGIGLAFEGNAPEGGVSFEQADVHARVSAPFQGISFSEDVVPILEARCVGCHGGVDEETGEVLTEVGLDMTSYETLMAGSEYGPIIEPGGPDSSIMVEMVVTGDMPLEGDPVPPAELETIRNWIAEGANNN